MTYKQRMSENYKDKEGYSESLNALDELAYEIEGLHEVIQYGGDPFYILANLERMKKYIPAAIHHIGTGLNKPAEAVFDPFEAFNRPMTPLESIDIAGNFEPDIIKASEWQPEIPGKINPEWAKQIERGRNR